MKVYIVFERYPFDRPTVHKIFADKSEAEKCANELLSGKMFYDANYYVGEREVI